MATYDASPEPRKVETSRATAWLGDGWRMFNNAPGVWVAIAVVSLLIHTLFNVVPGVGQMASMLLTPALMAGLMLCSRNSADQGSLTFEQMFAGFRHQLGNLVMLGLLMLLGFAVIAVISMAVLGVIGGASLISAIQHSNFGTAELGTALIAVLVAILVWVALSVPLTMAIWFAPALVYFDGMAPLAALKSSFRASLHNWLPLSVYGLLLTILAVIASIPMFLGWLLLLPVASISIYLSYREIFH